MSWTRTTPSAVPFLLSRFDVQWRECLVRQGLSSHHDGARTCPGWIVTSLLWSLSILEALKRFIHSLCLEALCAMLYFILGQVVYFIYPNSTQKLLGGQARDNRSYCILPLTFIFVSAPLVCLLLIVLLARSCAILRLPSYYYSSTSTRSLGCTFSSGGRTPPN
jgi:hypothetical protein